MNLNDIRGGEFVSPPLDKRIFMKKIIDFHVHCGNANNTFYPVRKIVQELKSKKIEKAVMSSFAGIYDPDEQIEDIKKMAATDEGFLIPLYWLNPYDKNWKEKIKKADEIKKICGIKLHPTANIYEPEYKFLKPVFNFCAKTNKFIFFHTDIYGSSPHKIEKLISDFCEVDVVLAHMEDPVTCIYLADKYKNVYLETSFQEQHRMMVPLKTALKCLGNERFFFGSDYPVGFYKNDFGKRNYENIIKAVKKELPVEAARKILHDNAIKFFQKHGI